MTIEPRHLILLVIAAVVVLGALYLLLNRPPAKAEVAPPASVESLRQQERIQTESLRDTRRRINDELYQTDAENRRIRFGNSLPQTVLGLVALVVVVVLLAFFLPPPDVVVKDSTGQTVAAIPANHPAAVVVAPLTKDDLRQVLKDEVPPIVNREIDKRLPVQQVIQPSPVAPIVQADLPPSISAEQNAINKAVKDDIGTLKTSTADINNRLSANTTQLSNIDAKLDSVLARPPKTRVIRRTVRKTVVKPVQMQPIIIQAPPQPQDNGLFGISSPLFSFRLGPQRRPPPPEPPLDYYGPVRRCPYFHGADYYRRC